MLRCWGCGASGSSLRKLLQKFGSTARQVRMFISPCFGMLYMYKCSLYRTIYPSYLKEGVCASLWTKSSVLTFSLTGIIITVTVASMPLIWDCVRPIQCNWIPSSVLVGSWRHKTKYWIFRVPWVRMAMDVASHSFNLFWLRPHQRLLPQWSTRKGPASLGRSQVASKLRGRGLR